jgi:hypothetical protein
MVYRCDRQDSNGEKSIDSLLDRCHIWLENFLKKVGDSGLEVSKRDTDNLYIGSEMMVYCYRDMPRSAEKAYAFEHPLAINDLLLDAYNGIYRIKNANRYHEYKITAPKEFTDCFRKNYLEIFHTSFFHDTEELGIFPVESIKKFYDGLKMKGKDIASNVEFMSLPKAANDTVISSRLKFLKSCPVPLYCKI